MFDSLAETFTYFLRSGRCRASYTCSFSIGDSAVEVTGKLVIKVHYFEDGNVQLNSEFAPSFSCNASVSSGFCFFVSLFPTQLSVGS